MKKSVFLKVYFNDEEISEKNIKDNLEETLGDCPAEIKYEFIEYVKKHIKENKIE